VHPTQYRSARWRRGLHPKAPVKLSQLQEISVTVPYNTILQEVDRLKQMSARLELLANRHSPVTEALISISASILGIATVLEVLVISKSETRPV
jgi:hypothetical protein